MITIKNLILAGVTCLCISTVGGYAEAATPRAYKSSHKAQSSAQSLKSMFKNAIGKYPFDIKMLDKPALKSRLIKLMGKSRYNYMYKNFDVQTPIEFNAWNYHTSACQAHNCGSTEFEISYNPKSDNLCVRYRVDSKESIFKEKTGNAIWDY